MVKVKVKEGVLEGEIIENVYGNPFYSFKGIPYAEPPLGDLRFQAPKPKTPWTGVRQAKQHGPVCCQYDYLKTLQKKGEEDCLYLNVYTPNISPQEPLPVMVYIHGGGFVSGSSNDDLFGPEFLIKHNVILVTINYRLEVLGFLCLETEDIPGNAGMKDQVAAFKWVQSNIQSFGGDPNKVTIFGESAGAASVSLHLVSPMSKGLFKRAIMQSGTLLCPWVQTHKPRERAILLARELGCKSNYDAEIVEFFKNIPAEALVKQSAPLIYVEYFRTSPKTFFGIVIEKQFGQECFLSNGENMYDVLKGGIHEGVEVINGHTEDEGIVYFAMGCNAEEEIEQANKLIEFYVPYDLTIYLPMLKRIELGNKIKEHYLKDEVVSKEHIDDLLKCLSMIYFVYAAVTWQKICAKRNKNKLYFYTFSCKSERNIFARVLGGKFISDRRTPVSHGDDLSYIFPCKIALTKVDINSKTYQMIDQVTKLWTNFAKFGDPTPDSSLGAKWLPYSIENQHYLDIGEKLTPGTSPNKQDMDFWENIYREYYPQFLF
ncbi:unnamed protein product [Colias eurytheme]|nr:unnamed protein product [Colias eurytheme]